MFLRWQSLLAGDNEVKHENITSENSSLEIPVLWQIETRMWNMISLPATPTVCLEQKSENFESRNITLSMPSQSQK